MDNAKASGMLNLVNEQLSELKIKLVKKYNTSKKHLSNHGLHLNQSRKGEACHELQVMQSCECNSENIVLGVTDNLSNDERFPRQVESKQNSNLGIEELISLRGQYYFNPKIGYLNIKSLRNKIEKCTNLHSLHK